MKYYIDNKINIQNMGNFYEVAFDGLNEEGKKAFKDDINEETITIEENDLSKYVDNYDYVRFDYYDDYAFNEFLDQIKDYTAYLVLAYGNNWLGQNGYSVRYNKADIFVRDYDVTQIITKRVSNKTFEMREYSHDVPMGARLVVTGLTDQELAKVNEMSFQEIFEKYGRD